ncbi:unnamed protein product (macronuclear) [Paramecium tetraurelia]|uniref:Cyclic nucleotide-binding domain-containing protein n=1 Tax=Paramecium tetraurelia TaxID=5888 RepID=A0BR60_PARTE|nr:uncharacterized protein GSPATT00031257001 [Paramecium tetraurelia]CAK61027.1 unnamed protein product [Paramecium tetraurelia]|eukprot:XP_001428425.1 hypothetical protein (macronuclear) [Paramecium tetraurelia strain d4-2]
MNSELGSITERAPLKTQPTLPKQQLRPAFLKTVNLKTIQTNRMNSFPNKIWRDRALLVLMQVLRFISLITRSPFASKFSLLDRNMFRIIGDKAADFNYYLLNDYFKYMKPQQSSRVKYFLLQHLYKICYMKGFMDYLTTIRFTFEPESIFLLLWNILMLVNINLNVLYITVKFSFDFENYPPEDYEFCEIYLFRIPYFLYLIDIIIKLNTCYYEAGYLVRDRNKIWYNFYKNNFINNLFILVPTAIYFLAFQNSALYLFMLLKALQIPTITESIIDRVELKTNYWIIYDLIRLIYVILYESHICCCGLFYVGLLNKEASWLLSNGLVNETWIIKYLSTFYWSIITMTTIGYGDIAPQNILEKTFLIFVAIFSCCTFGYSINCIGQSIGQLQSKNHQIRVDMNDLKQYLRIRGYNTKLQIKILRFFEYLWKDQRNENQLDINKFNQQLPSHLHNEMMIDLNMKSISKIPFFKENFNEDFISALASKFIEEKLVPFNTIFSKNDPSNFLYILCDGEIEYFVEIPEGSATMLSIQTISGYDEIFGQQEFLLDQNYEVSCRSTTSSRILKISKADFNLIAKKFGYEKYCQLKDLVKFSGRFDEFHLHCVGCNKSTHMLYQCPMLTGFPNKTKIIIQYRKNQAQERDYIKRNNLKRRLSSLIFEAQISDTVLYYLLKDPKLSQQISSQYQIQTLKQQQLQKELQNYNNDNRTQKQAKDEVRSTIRKQSVLKIKGRKQSQYIKRLPDFLNCQYINFKSMPEDKIKTGVDNISKNISAEHSEAQSSEIFHMKLKNQEETNILEQRRISADLAKSLSFKLINHTSLDQDLRKSDADSIKENSSLSQASSQSPTKQSKDVSPGIDQITQCYMGTYKDIFEKFDKFQDYQNYMTHMNSSKILEQLNLFKETQNFTDFMNVNFVRKRRSKRNKLVIKLDY